MSIPLGTNYVGILLYSTPTASRDNAGAATAQQAVRITRTNPAPTDPDLEVDTFVADSAALAALRAIPGPNPGLLFNREDIGKIGPQELRATLYYSNNNFFGLGEIGDEDSVAFEGAFDATDTDREYQIPVVYERVSVVPGAADTTTQYGVRVYTESSRITEWQIRAVSPTYNISTLRFIASQVGAFHLINGNIYKFLGTKSVKQIGSGVDTQYSYTYAWEIDNGARFREVGGGFTEGEGTPAVFTDPQIVLGSTTITFSGSWFRPPFSELYVAEQSEDITLPFIVGPVTITRPVVDYFWAGFSGSQTGWALLPGDPIGLVS